MSTINSYFKARKNKNTPVYISDKAKQHGLVVQAPEEKKIYHTSATKKQIHKEKPKGILRFMSPIKQQETEKEEKEEEEHIVCKIKKSTKLTDFWKDLVNNYDADSSLEEDCGKKRSHDDDTERNVRIRFSSSNQTLQSTLSDYYYYDDDDNEDLTRPIKRRFSLTETNNYLLEIVNELVMDDNSWCKLEPISA